MPCLDPSALAGCLWVDQAGGEKGALSVGLQPVKVFLIVKMSELSQRISAALMDPKIAALLFRMLFLG